MSIFAYLPHLLLVLVAAYPGLGCAQGVEEPIAARLPDPDSSPLTPKNANDPILNIADALADEASFREVIREAMRANPMLAEGRAEGRAAIAGKRATEAGLYPRIDLALNANRSIGREFSNDPDNVIERARGNGRVDATASVEQILLDFGATRRRIDAAIERISASEAEFDRKSDTVALRAISAWYDLFAFGHLVELADNHIAQNRLLRDGVNRRIAQGVSAEVDLARIDSALASAQLRRAQFGREYDNARARFTELFSLAAPNRVARAPAPQLAPLSDEALTARAAVAPPVRLAEANARAARADAAAAKADVQPTITAGIDAGRYGLYEPGRRDYDIRGRLTFRYRLFGPGHAQAAEAQARAEAAEARAEATRMEAEREARIAWSDVSSLDATMGAYRDDYSASRITRDATVERFRVARGTLFDALDAEDRLFTAAASYIRALADRDIAVFVALARSGDLLKSLDVEPASQRTFH